MNFLSSFLMFLGRVCISVIFILAGLHKFMDYQGTATYMAAKHLPVIPFFLYTAATIELFGGLCLLIGLKTRYAAALLALFLIPVSFIFHDFWNISEAAERQLQMGHFLSNLAIFGGLLYVISCGGGRCCVERKHD